MKALLIKDYLEQRMYFMIILGVAAISLLVAAYFKQLDPGVALILLFITQGPFFVYMAANHQISSEVKNGTWRFLSSLPVSRLQLWGAKLTFVSLYTVLLYSIYILLALISGVSSAELWRLISASPGLTLGLPLLIMAYGFFTTMLPQGFATISALVLAPVIYAIFHNPLTAETINYEMAVILAAALFLLLSFGVCKLDHSMNSPWRGLKGIAILFVGIMLALVCWSALDTAAEHFWSFSATEDMVWVPINDGKTLMMRVHCSTPAWDVVQPKSRWAMLPKQSYSPTELLDIFTPSEETRRIFTYDIDSGKMKQVGRRNNGFDTDYKCSNNGFVMAYVSSISNGFFRGHNYAIIDKTGKIVKNLPDNINGKDVQLIDDQRFIYAEEVKAGKNTITEFRLYQEGAPEKVVFSATDDFNFSSYLLMPDVDRSSPAKVFIVGSSDNEKGKTVLISIDDGRKTVLPITPSANIKIAGADFIVFDKGRWNKDTDQYTQNLEIARLDGSIEPLDWIATDAILVGVSATGKILAMLPGEEIQDWYSPWCDSVIEVDPVARSSKEIIRFPYAIALKMDISTTGEHALLYCNDVVAKPAKRQLMAINLATLAVSEFSELNSKTVPEDNGAVGFTLFDHAYNLKGNRFMFAGVTSDNQGGIYEVDAAKASIVHHISYKSLIETLKKGGTNL